MVVHDNGTLRPLQDPALLKWWPATQALDLVLGPAEEVAAAVKTEFERYAGDGSVASRWSSFDGLGSVFASAPYFANVVTFIAVLPTKSQWSVLWNNSFLCDGYD
jgi:hypothetical protein